MRNNDKNWRDGKGWGRDDNEEYAQVLYKRAIGEMPEMESSKAAAKILSTWIKDDSSILDVGCGVGHYLTSIKKITSREFYYTGVDNSALYVKLARKAFSENDKIKFLKGDISNLPFKEKSFDIVMSNNVFLHLPSIKTPLEGLCRVAREHVVIRTLIGDRSFRIQELRTIGDEFDEDGLPKNFNYFNIYSRSYLEHLLSHIPAVKRWEIETDNDFDAERISSDAAQVKSDNTTKMLGNYQINGYILEPWCFVKIFL